MSERYISIEDACDLVGCSSGYLQKLSKKGFVQVKRENKKIKVRWVDLKKVVDLVELSNRLVKKEVFDLETPPEGILLHENIPQEKMDLAACSFKA